MDTLAQISLALFGIMPGNYSGISHIAGNDYAIVNDKDTTDGFMILSLDIDSVTGKLKEASLREPAMMVERRKKGEGTYRDCEGVAFCDATNTVFVSGEEDQRIIEYSLDGPPTGRELAVPESFGKHKIRPNLGFEALAYNSQTKTFWTTTEGTLREDGEATDIYNKVKNRLRFLAFGLDLQPRSEFFYEMDLPQTKAEKGQLVHGVPSIVALDDGRLIVVEREAFIAKRKLGSRCRIKLYLATPANGVLEKKLLANFSTGLRVGKMNFANFEGACLGPKLSDGRQTLIMIADSQNAAGNHLFRLKDYIRILTITY